MSDQTFRIAIEKHIVRALLEGYAKSLGGNASLKNFCAEISEEVERFDSVEDAFNFVMDLDEAIVKFGKNSWVKLVFGNDGYDVIGDYTVSLDKHEWFRTVVETAALIELGKFKIVVGDY
jgi:hypothetical protein